ncbi:tRNA preQ1(34) S-adenosylmethionine ribosyltrans ferase-isomerase QueA [Desulfonema ishimotonii]|uniref:S-adenosylmethionine:tRNA ribosyltransferase-isomerase n=1 Tax=Desulfonema ishimotonii TaxID=45657 RepID=A0A401G3P5_9BACT|nr:tRNA preQ1(34) S-adenosylmethionine ribosyltransferase-isomerase QueA [Desulfonema ishimotonii]GBC63859.1 tRNA preQ1(34) S-adenosylmethionine ribosyltrans ferase-isomerase QueA [Desulfonema ishimotonii]
MYLLKDYFYELPEDRIAQKPVGGRDGSRLLQMSRETGALSHRTFADLPECLSGPDVLVINNTKVIPGRLTGKKETGGRAELLILNYGSGSRTVPETGDLICECLVKASKRPRTGTRFFFDHGLTAEILESGGMIHTVRFSCPGNFEEIMYRIGEMPLPPYIKRNGNGGAPCDDEATYQTVYAAQKGAIAAPTAGLHFTDALLARIRARGVQIVTVTLHVGYGTFVPVRVPDIREHQMHSEWYSVPPETAAAINAAKENGGRVVAVGTTSVRTLEYVAAKYGEMRADTGNCDLFIYPGYAFRVVDAMITNFHLPESTLLMLVSAFAGREEMLNAYKTAVEEKYRFYSYGDAMLIA